MCVLWSWAGSGTIKLARTSWHHRWPTPAKEVGLPSKGSCAGDSGEGSAWSRRGYRHLSTWG
eukprot:436764-Amorphochlora_amoeboformis.AAC.1